jgi:hypothetical protein
MTDEEFRAVIAGTLACRVNARERCGEAQERFLARCFYQAGAYDEAKVLLGGGCVWGGGRGGAGCLRGGLLRASKESWQDALLLPSQTVIKNANHKLKRKQSTKPKGLLRARRAHGRRRARQAARQPHLLPVHPAKRVPAGGRQRGRLGIEQVRVGGRVALV